MIRRSRRKRRNFGAKGNTLNNHKMMGSLRMFGARGLLLIFIALGTNGQLLTEKIPLGKVFVLYGNLWKTKTRTTKEAKNIQLPFRNELLPFSSSSGGKYWKQKTHTTFILSVFMAQEKRDLRYVFLLTFYFLLWLVCHLCVGEDEEEGEKRWNVLWG